MAEFFDALDDKHIAMIGQQPVFFVATAAEDARINLSPKGYDAFRVLGPKRVAYLDLAGSGNETHAHLSRDGRITLMFCNFDRPALILVARQDGDVGWRDAVAKFGSWPRATVAVIDAAGHEFPLPHQMPLLSALVDDWLDRLELAP